MKKLLLSIFIISINVTFSQSLNWAKNNSGIYGEHITVDAVGNTYVTMDFKNGSYTNMIVVKHDQNGNVIWKDTVQGVYGVVPKGIKTDANSNVYVIGEFSYIVDFNPGFGINNLGSGPQSYSPRFYFLLKLNSNGQFVYAKQIGANPFDLVLNSLGDIFITGTFGGTVDFDPSAATYSLTSPGNSIYINKLDNFGNFVWAKQFGSSGGNQGSSIDCDALGNIYTTGFFSNTVDFDADVVNTFTMSTGGAALKNPFISKLDGNGNFIWAKQLQANSNLEAKGIRLDANNNVVIIGNYYNSFDADPSAGTLLLPGGFSSSYLVKLNTNGNFIWAKNIKSNVQIESGSLDINLNNEILFCGYINGQTNFNTNGGTYNINSNGSFDGFVSKLDSTGTLVFAKNLGGSGVDLISDVVITTTNFYTTGYFDSNVDFDFEATATILTSVGTSNAFVAKYSNIATSLTETEKKLITFSIYPNPAKEILNVKLEMLNEEPTEIKITNLLGEVVLKDHLPIQNSTTDSYRYNISNFNSGVYFVTITNKGVQSTQKIIIE